MKYRFLQNVLVALSVGVAASVSLAADAPAQKAHAATAAKNAVAKSKAQSPKPKLVDINSASKEELRKLPQIGDAEADRIIAGRPYLSKAHLQTHKVVSPAVYQGLRDLVVARQKDAKFVKAGK